MNDIREGFTRVSSIASAYAGYGNIQQHVLDRAAARGSCVHALVEDYMNHIVIGDDRWSFMGDDLRGYFTSWKNFYKPYVNAEVLLQEQRIDDDATMLTGEPDLIIMHEGKKILMDWKCSYKVGKHWQLQGSGYHYLASTVGIKIDHVIFVKLCKKGKEPLVTEFKPNIPEFLAAYDLYLRYLQDAKCNLEEE